MSIRLRFALTVALVVAVTIAIFAALSITAMDRALRSSVLARLKTAAQAVATTADYHHGRISIDASDLRTLSSIHADTPFSVFDGNGTQVGGNALPSPLRERTLLSVSVPILHRGAVVGSVRAWQSDLPIRDFERDAMIVSIVLGALLIAGSIALALSVAHSFETMLARVETAYARERRFAGDASHELRAPLTVLHAETELALRRERTPDEYRRALQSIQHETARLESLVEDLLAAARADVDAHARETIDAVTLLRDLADRVRPVAALHEVGIDVRAEGVAQIEANRAMLERALLAIADNAIAFTPRGGQIRLHATGELGRASIQIADDGPGFTPEALAHATERFWRGDPSRPRGGTGLGLAIARTLLEANGGRLELANRPGGGAVVSARFEGR